MTPSPAKNINRSDSTLYILTLISIIILIVSAGYVVIQQQKRFLLDEKHKEIATIADLKTSQLVQWRKERFAEGASIRANAMMASRINDYFSAGADKAKIRRECSLWIANLIDLGQYSKGILFTPNGTIISSVSDISPSPAQHYLDLVAEAASEHELILSDFHRDALSDDYSINLSIPIMFHSGAGTYCIAVLVLDVDPTKELYPLVQAWPTTSTTAETHLVKQEGDAVLFLNELRYKKKTSLPFLLPLTDNNKPAVKAATGQEGSFEGVDYRNVAVLSATRVIPGTRWGIVAKLDTSEVLSPLSKTVVIVVLVGFGMSITLMLIVFLWNLRRKADALRLMMEAEQNVNLALKRSEESLIRSRDYHLKLIEFFPSLTWRSDTDGLCDYFNQTWLTFTGRMLEQELGNGWTEGVHPDDLDQCIITYMDAFQARMPFVMEYRLRFNDGSYHWLNDHGSPYYDHDGTFTGYIGSCYDINIQKNAERELLDIHAYLEQQIIERTSNLVETNLLLRREIIERELLEQQLHRAKRLEAIGQIAGGVAHEVRNPLNAILTITEALFKEEEIASNPDLDLYILHIRTQVNRLAHLMNDLLDLGRTIPIADIYPVLLSQVCRDTLTLWKSTGQSKNKRGLLTSDNDNTSHYVLADGIKLQQVFFNLLENAGQHSPEGNKIIVQLTHNNSDPHDGMAIVQIIDQGSGIAEDKLSQVFEPFYTDRKGGTGLGLALVKHFIENMGGSVYIWNNNPSPGCTVEIRLPLCPEEIK